MAALVRIITNPNLASGININISADEQRYTITLSIQKPLELLGLIEVLGNTIQPKSLQSLEFAGDILLSDKIKEKISKKLINREIAARDFIDFEEVPRKKSSEDFRKLKYSLTTNTAAPNMGSRKSNIANYVNNVLGNKYSEDEAYSLFVEVWSDM